LLEQELELDQKVGLECELVGDLFDVLYLFGELAVDLRDVLTKYSIDFLSAHLTNRLKFDIIRLNRQEHWPVVLAGGMDCMYRVAKQ